MISHRQADLVDKIPRRFRWIFAKERHLDIVVNRETDDGFYAQGKYTAVFGRKKNGYYLRPGWVLVMQTHVHEESPMQPDGTFKHVYLNAQYLGPIEFFDDNGNAHTTQGHIVDPVKVYIDKCTSSDLHLKSI